MAKGVWRRSSDGVMAGTFFQVQLVHSVDRLIVFLKYNLKCYENVIPPACF